MKFWEAMREMQENGKMVRCANWDSWEYIVSDGDTMIDEDGDEAYIDFERGSIDTPSDLSASWEFYDSDGRSEFEELENRIDTLESNINSVIKALRMNDTAINSLIKVLRMDGTV